MTRSFSSARHGAGLMELTQLGSVWPTKFSFAHSFLRMVCRMDFSCEISDKRLDEAGRGHIAYRARLAGHTLTFVVFSDPLPEDLQQDRIIATRWDAWAALFLGEPPADDIAQSREQIQQVTWGRAAPGTITWSRANRSARLFEHVVASLAAGRQPDPRQLNQVGYLIRTTGFSGNGRNGMHDYAYLREIGHPLQAPYHAQMLAAYLWREFGYDLALHLARVRNPHAVDLSDESRRFVGVGNSSGIGLVPFVVRHPRLLDRWIGAREQALADMYGETFDAADARCDEFERQIARAIDYFAHEPSGELDEFVASDVLHAELRRARERFVALRSAWRPDGCAAANPVVELIGSERARSSTETVELLHSLLLECHDGGNVDGGALHADESLPFDPALRAGVLRDRIETQLAWVSRFGAQVERPFFWYASEENMEPRRGCRNLDEGEQYALPVDVMGRVEELLTKLRAAPPEQTLGRFLIAHPDMRFMVGWASTLADSHYAIARTDLLAQDFSPLRIMRFQLATYGMLKFRPRSRTWLRATLFQGAGLPRELAAGHAGDGLLPKVPGNYESMEEPLLGE
ncbi:hypothetical protein G3N58_21140 [Paraburkholderia sp. Ac-20342]|uniref:hypothetical protein n=1 Tax=Paraburkholderia sp. Ac-20342 TaxID=2703889 RepID=UPI00197CF054|nr:hypothetical protein [Paraburkholderia sp. Ac-20342]MBN3849310.1 hypothetical protein [Paraburkholderia sp. Ac-20342]